MLWLVPALPLLGFAVLALTGKHLPKKHVAVIGAGSVGISMLLTFAAAVSFSKLPSNSFRQTLWTWVQVSNFSPAISFYLDSLSLVYIFIVTFVGFLIHLYSTEFMADDEGYSRFFAYMNLFVASMLVLVLADNLVLLLLGWEGVGLCSYLLIGFWYTEPANGRAARKAFVVTRLGDTAMETGLFLLFFHLGTLSIQDLVTRAHQTLQPGSPVIIAACLLLLGGAAGKSGQVPLQVWLPDAMAGPTPVSALIHAATMVTAGVYLIARMNGLFLMAPEALFLVGAVGAVTLFLSACTALVTRDLKRVLAYSTISQIGYMFLGLGVGAWAAAVFHFVTHAFFKSLLFLSSGVVIEAMHEEHDIFKMGGLKNRLPVAFWTFLAGAASLSALPFITAGYYSKDLVLEDVWGADAGSWLLISGIAASLLTALYSFRLVFLVFFGKERDDIHEHAGMPVKIPLIALAVLALCAGFAGKFVLPFLYESLPASPVHAPEISRGFVLAVLPVAGAAAAYWIYLLRREYLHQLTASPAAREVHRFLFNGWGFDALYQEVFVKPFVVISRLNAGDFIDTFYDGVAAINAGFWRALSRTESGLLRRYTAGVVIGGIIFVGIMVFL